MLKRASVLSGVKVALSGLCALPAVNLWRALEHANHHFIRSYDYRVLTLSIAESGAWAFIFLFLALACTPLQRLTGFRWPGELRRTLGLFAFAYSCLHFLVYLVIGQKLRWDYVYIDAFSQLSRIPGWLALLLLVPLALTSTDGMIRRVGAKRWKQLHRLAYLATLLALAHLVWTEHDRQAIDYPLSHKFLPPFAILLVLRIAPLSWLRKKMRRSAA